MFFLCPSYMILLFRLINWFVNILANDLVKRFELKLSRQCYAISERFPLSVCLFGVLVVSDFVNRDVSNGNLDVSVSFSDARCSNWITARAFTTWATSNGTWRDVCFWSIWYVTSACGKAYLHREKLNILSIQIPCGIFKRNQFFYSRSSGSLHCFRTWSWFSCWPEESLCRVRRKAFVIICIRIFRWLLNLR